MPIKGNLANHGVSKMSRKGSSSSPAYKSAGCPASIPITMPSIDTYAAEVCENASRASQGDKIGFFVESSGEIPAGSTPAYIPEGRRNLGQEFSAFKSETEQRFALIEEKLTLDDTVLLASRVIACVGYHENHLIRHAFRGHLNIFRRKRGLLISSVTTQMPGGETFLASPRCRMLVQLKNSPEYHSLFHPDRRYVYSGFHDVEVLSQRLTTLRSKPMSSECSTLFAAVEYVIQQLQIYETLPQ